MDKAFAVTKSRLDTFLFTALLPLLGIGCGVLSLIMKACINQTFLITFVLFPLGAIGLLALCIFSPMRHLFKGLLSAIALILFVVLFLGGKLFGTHVVLERYNNEDAAPHYASILEYDDRMPSIDEIDQPVNIEYCNVKTRYFIFFPEADYLICRYTEEEYARQKSILDAKYIFQRETMYSYDDLNETYTDPCEPVAELDGYQFRVLSTEMGYAHHTDYPWHMNLIGCSDEEQQIIYLSFNDTDVDYHTSLRDFLYEECGWRYVR